MENITRKCIALQKINKLYVDSLVEQKRAKNFSKAINEMIEQDRRKQNEKNCNNHCEDSI